MGYGKRVWIFPDAELPPEGVNLIPGHESVIITNVSSNRRVEANLKTAKAVTKQLAKTNEFFFPEG